MTGTLADAQTPKSAAGARRGQVVAGKYRIERLVGRGGMGEVYEARHVVVGRRFAVKFLHPGVASPESSARFLREAQAAGALDNEHIAAVIDFDTASDGAPFLVMEYLSGESLATTVAREGVLSVPRVMGLLLQVCDGLAAAHEAGIVHRDLKPDNLFLVPRPDGAELVKIVDFGVAKLVGGASENTETQSGAVLGTPLYMAPEQARGEKSVDLRVDLHALGVIAYELLSGQRPHPGDGYNAILAHILTQPVRPLAELCPELPRGLREAVERAMAFDPRARPTSASAWARDLLPFAGREVTSVAAQFDLRRPGVTKSGAVTLDTAAHEPSPSRTVAQTPAGGTLQSAVRDAREPSSENRKSGRALWSVALLIGAAALSWFLGRAGRQTSPSVPPNDEASRSSAGVVTLPRVGAAISAAPSSVALVIQNLPEKMAPARANPSNVAPAAPAAATPAAATPAAATPAVTSPAAVRPAVTLAVTTPAVTTPVVRPSATPPARAAAPARDPAEVTFDEKNPY